MKMKVLLTGFVLLSLILIISCQNSEEKVYKFGAVLPLSGSNALYGKYSQEGMDLAVEDINAKGGINGRQVKVIYEDVGLDKSKIASATQKLVSLDDVDGLITLVSSISGAVTPIAEENKIPLVYAAGTNALAEGKNYVFKDYGDGDRICSTLVKQAIQEGYRKIGFLAIESESTHLCKKALERESEDATILTEFYNAGEKDFKTQITKLKSQEINALFLYGFEGDCLVMFKELQELNFKPKLFLPFYEITCGTKKGIEVGSELLKNAYGSSVNLYEDSTDPDFVNFKNRLKEKGWATLATGSAFMYDIVMELARAYEDCNAVDKDFGKDIKNANTLCAANNLRNLDYKGVSGRIRYNGKQLVERDYMLVEFIDSKWVKVG